MPRSFSSLSFKMLFSSWGAYTQTYFCVVLLPLFPLQFTVLCYTFCLSSHEVQSLSSFLCPHSFSSFNYFFWNVSDHNCVYQEMNTLESCVLALTFTISPANVSSAVSQNCSLSGHHTLINYDLPSDKDICVHLLSCFYLKQPTDNLGNAFEAGKQNHRSLCFPEAFYLFEEPSHGFLGMRCC